MHATLRHRVQKNAPYKAYKAVLLWNFVKRFEEITARHRHRRMYACLLCNAYNTDNTDWLRDTVVECWSVTGELSMSYARPEADGWPLMWVNRPLQGQPTRPTQPFILSRSINE